MGLDYGAEEREFEGERERQGGEGGGRVIGGEARKGLEHLVDEEGQGCRSLGFHPPRHSHRYELRAQTSAFPAPQPRLR